MIQDIRYALRQLRRSPVFALTAVLTLGLGLGAAATMWSVVHQVLLSPVPYRDPQQLVGIAFTFPGAAANDDELGVSADFLAAHAHAFTSVGVAQEGDATVNLSTADGGAEPTRVPSGLISRGYLPTLGVAPLLGRNFSAAEDRPDGPQVALLSYDLWRTTFHANPQIVGRTIHIDEDPVTVIGVLPRDFKDPSMPQSTALWRPLALSPSQPGYEGTNYSMIGRLAPGATLAAAQAEIATYNAPFYARYPSYRSWRSDVNQNKDDLHGFRVWPLAAVLTSNVRGSLLLLAAAVAAVLGLACLNLAGLTSTRAAGRMHELGIRSALGSSRWGLLRLLITEGALLAIASAVLAFGIARIAEPALLAVSPLSMPALGVTTLWRQGLFLALAAAGACLVFSVSPACIALRRAPALPGRTAVSLDRAQTRFGAALVTLQAALTMILLAGASLLLGVFVHLVSTSPGFAPRQLVAAQVTLRGSRYQTTLATSQFADQVLDRLRGVPGVEGAAAIDGFPLDRGLNLGMEPAEHHGGKGITELRPVTPDYFSVMRLKLIAGRLLNAQDRGGSLRVALVSRTAANEWWPGQSAIGHIVEFEGKDKAPMQVVGVVSDTHTNSPAEPFADMVYVPYSQMSDDLTRMINGWFNTSFVLRVSAKVPVARAMNNAVHAVDAELPVSRILTLQSYIDKSTAAPRFFSWLSSGFALFALLLSGLGLFGLLSYQVTQRTRELGLRLALGATRERILRTVMGRGLALTLVGAGAGLFASLALPSLLASIVPDLIYTGDTPAAQLLVGSYVLPLLAALLLVLAAAAASAAPAWRAAQTQPMEALRAE